jgi:hypothetical protein
LNYRGNAIVEPNARRRGRNAARRAIEQTYAEAVFKLSDGLAQGWSGEAKVIGGARKARPIHNSRKGFQFGKIWAPHSTSISK